MKTLSEMLTYRRAHDSAGEAEFIARYIAPVTTDIIAAADGTIHAYHVTIGESRNVFCAHTDSVHNRQNPATRQPVAFDTLRGEFFVSDKKQRDCLGADDAAGCFVMLQMIAANVPGLYIFFRGEERGGIGSRYVAENHAAMFGAYDCAIQFDRRGQRSIITHMAIGRTCSDAFAESLADALGMAHGCDDTGSFTDTANLSGIIPECTNVSIGYENEHSSFETLNADYVMALTAAMIAAFSGTGPVLTIERDPYAVSASLADMTDDEIWWLANSNDAEAIERVLYDARDALAWGILR